MGVRNGPLLALLLCGCGQTSSQSSDGGAPPPGAVEPGPQPPTMISVENAQTGDSDWQLVAPARAHEVEGYGTKITLAPGESLDVKVNVASTARVRWSVYRVGWYGGAGARRILDGGPVSVKPQRACPRDPVTSRVECSWATAFTVTVPANAVSGVYLIRLIIDGPHDFYVPFVVHDGRAADVLVNVNVSTWQAYNQFGGESLYADASGTMPSGKAWEVSFDRPFNESDGAGRFLYWEVYFVRWAEALGYDVTYTTLFDLIHDPKQALSAKTFVSLANDEYWTVDERAAVEAARDQGVNLAFLGADQVLWRVRLAPSSSGAPERVIVCYKDQQARDPVLAQEGAAYATARFRDEPDPHPANALVGVMYDGWMLLPQPWVVADPANAATSWLFAGTGLRAGDALPSLLDDEADARYPDSEPPGLVVLAQSPFVDARSVPKPQAGSWYRAPSGAEVVGFGSIGWPMGLGAPGYADSRAARIARNLLDRFVGAGRKGGGDPANAPWLAPARHDAVIGAWAGAVATVASGDPLEGPAGVAEAPDGSIYVADSPAHAIRRVAPDGTIATLAGDGSDGYGDGPGASAHFAWPLGLALAPDGALLVADSDDRVIRRVAPDAAHSVTTWAGAQSPTGGFADGPGASARFGRPTAIAFARDGALLVADSENGRIRRVDPGPGHAVTTFAGAGSGFADGPAASARFGYPTALAVAADGTVYVLDSYDQSLRRIGTDAARTVTTIAGGVTGPGLVDGGGASARLSGQGGLAWSSGRLYFSDVGGDRIRVVTPGADAASTRVATFAGDGSVALRDGPGAAASFAAPLAIAVAPDGSLLVADSGNRAIRRIH